MEENKNIIDEVTLEKDEGHVNISDEVVASIAGIAANEIDGVSGMAGSFACGIAETLGAKKNPQKGVRIDIKPEGATIDLFIIVEFGKRIPELAWNIQENVKNSVETMTGIDVLKVNVHIEGISFEKPAKQEKPAAEEEKVIEVPENIDEDPENEIQFDE